jgi:type IV secretory pathway VirD2 relaxase
LRYIQRDGVDRTGDPGKLYGPASDEVDGSEFTERCDGDRHQFRIIISPDDGDQLADLKPFVRDLMQHMERDLETRLDWVAVDHYNTGHPHSHIVIRGKDQDGHDLIMARDYVTHGIRQRAGQLLTLELGPEDEFEQQLKLFREVEAERFTGIDRSILKHVDQGYLTISAMPPQEPQAHTAHMRRLKHLSDLGLARERQTGVWEIQPDIERKLRSLGKRNDIIATMHRATREAGIDRPAGSFAIIDKDSNSKQVVGRLAASGLTDELSDSHYVVIDGVDGRVHYADLGRVQPESLPGKGMIVSIESRAQEDGKRAQARLRFLSYLSLEDMVSAQGPTWLDRELVGKPLVPVAGQGFGSDVSQALVRRQQWLVSQSLGAAADDGTFKPAPNMLAQLRQRELTQAVSQLAKELNLEHVPLSQGGQVSGTYRQPVNLASGKYAVIQKAHEFTLVPWRPELEQHRDKLIAGSVSGNGIAWDWKARGRGLAV